MDDVLTRSTDSAVCADAQARGDQGQRSAMAALLAGLRNALDSVAMARRAAVRRRRGLLQRRLLLGLELLCKLEEQVLFPALGDAIAASPITASPIAACPSAVRGAHPVAAMDASQADLAAQALGMLWRDIDLMRDVSMLVPRTAATNRDTLVGVLEGMANLHAERVDALVAAVPAASVAWDALEREMRGLLGRWRNEVLADGDIEDEDRDPVGLPPR